MPRGWIFALSTVYISIIIALAISHDAKADPDISSDGCVITIDDIPNNFCNGD